MSTPVNTDTAGVEKSYEEKVNSLLKTVETDEKGKLVFPEGTSEDLKFAANAVKRHRDTQGAYTKTSQQLKATEAEKDALIKLNNDKNKYDISPEKKEELDDLMYSDPETWRKQVNKLEQEASEKSRTELSDVLAQVSTDAALKFENERRAEILTNFVAANPEIKLNEDVLKYDIPPRLSKKLEAGDITFESYLAEVKAYLTKGKSIKKSEAPNMPNLGSIGGGDNPTSSESHDINWQDI